MSRFSVSLTTVVTTLFLFGCGGGGASQDSAPATSNAPPAATSAAAEPAPSGPEAGMITARSRLDQALAEARTWQADAQLTGVTTSLADGPSHTFWFYDVQSPSKGTCTRIRAMANGTVTNVGTGDECVLATPVSAEFVDSPVAYNAALAAGFKRGDSVQFGLRVSRDQALPAPQACWVVWSDADDDEANSLIRGWCIDPATGTFVARLSGRLKVEPRP